MSQRHAPRHSSSDTLAQDKITGIRGGQAQGTTVIGLGTLRRKA